MPFEKLDIVKPVDQPTIREPQERRRFGAETAKDFAGIGEGILRRSGRAAERIGEVQESFETGEISRGRKILEQAGFALGAGAGAVGESIEGAVKMVLPQKTEEALKGEIQRVAGGFVETILDEENTAPGAVVARNLISEYERVKEEDPNKARSIESALGALELAAEFVGLGTAKRVATPGLKAAKETLGEVIDEATGRLRKNISDEISIAAKETPKGIVRDMIDDVAESASLSELAEVGLTKAFKFAPGDVTRIQNLIGGVNVAQWAKANNLIGDTRKETLDLIADFKKNNYEAVREAVILDDNVFGFNDIPALEAVVDDLIAETAPLKSARFKNLNQRLKGVSDKFNKGEGDLMDVQTVKGAFDDLKSIYKRSGDVKQGVKFADMAESASELRRFIESRVSEKFPDINVRDLNRNVQIASEFLDSAITRSGKIDTQSIAELGDYAVFGLGQQVAPGLGLATFGTKKLLQSAPIQLRFARRFAGTGDIPATDIEGIKSQLTEALNEAMLGR